MAKELLPDALWLRARAAHPAFKHRNRRAGVPVCWTGRRSTGILFVLKTGIPWEYLPVEMCGGSRDDLSGGGCVTAAKLGT